MSQTAPVTPRSSSPGTRRRTSSPACAPCSGRGSAWWSNSGSTDGTPDLARSLGARVLHHPWSGWAVQRDFALGQARLPWVLFVDADERVPLDLAEEVQARVAQAEREGGPVGFWIPRQNVILGRWVRHAGWWPDHQMRLLRAGRGRYDPLRPVHELVQLDGPAGHLSNRLVHHNYVSWRQFWTKQRRYARAEAAALASQGVRAKPRNFVLQPLREFRRRYWTLDGRREGAPGAGPLRRPGGGDLRDVRRAVAPQRIRPGT